MELIVIQKLTDCKIYQYQKNSNYIILCTALPTAVIENCVEEATETYTALSKYNIQDLHTFFLFVLHLVCLSII